MNLNARWPRLTVLAASLGLTACVTNPPLPSGAMAPFGITTPAALPGEPGCERLPMSDRQRAQTGALVGAALGLVATVLSKGSDGKHFATGALGGALVGALASTAFKGSIDVEEQPDGTVKLKIPGSLMFASGQRVLSPDFQFALTKVTQSITKYCDLNVRVVGHTDSVGSLSSNMKLSEDRASAVVSHMSGQGFSRNRMQIEGRGPNDPIAGNTDELGRQQNRRVEIFIRPPSM